MLFKPHVISQEMPSELQEAVNINSWKDMVYMAYKIITRFDALFHGQITKDQIKIESSPVPLEKGSDLFYQVIVDGFGLIGFANEATIKE